MKTIKIYPITGSFAENKDSAKKIRVDEIMPELEKGKSITLDFDKIDSATQSFIHALISEVIRKYGIEILDKTYFRNCNETVKNIINLVTDYMQDID